MKIFIDTREEVFERIGTHIDRILELDKIIQIKFDKMNGDYYKYPEELSYIKTLDKEKKDVFDKIIESLKQTLFPTYD